MSALFLNGQNSMDRLRFTDLEYENKKRKTRREKFPERMDALIP